MFSNINARWQLLICWCTALGYVVNGSLGAAWGFFITTAIAWLLACIFDR